MAPTSGRPADTLGLQNVLVAGPSGTGGGLNKPRDLMHSFSARRPLERALRARVVPHKARTRTSPFLLCNSILGLSTYFILAT